MSEQLKPCPFCGGADIRPFDNSVVCNSCSASGPDLGHCVGAECRKDAIAAWNRRAEAQPGQTEYVRKDASDAAISAARAEGVREGMLKAAEIADQHRDPTGTEYGEGWDASASSIAKEVRAAAEAQP